jgi:hypothetical protein
MTWKRLQWMTWHWPVEDHNLTWQQSGVIACDCANYRTSQFSILQNIGFLPLPGSNQPHCEHVINFQLRGKGDFINDRLQVFSNDGAFCSNHEWRFEVDEARDILPFVVYFFKKKPSGAHTVMSWEVGLTPMVDTKGLMWNVYFQRESIWASDSGLLRVQQFLPEEEEFFLPRHIGFYNTTDPLLEIAKVAASSFVDIALCSPCATCGEILNPDHLKDPHRGRWDAIYRGHYLETHKGIGPCCDDSALVPAVPAS